MNVAGAKYFMHDGMRYDGNVEELSREDFEKRCHEYLCCTVGKTHLVLLS
jgi:hypothetical protein